MVLWALKGVLGEHRNFICAQNKEEPSQERPNYKEPSHRDEQYRPIQDLATHIPEELARQDPPWKGEQKQPTEEDAEEEQQQERNNTPGENVDKNGYMTSLGKPRQPKTTKANKKRDAEI